MAHLLFWGDFMDISSVIAVIKKDKTVLLPINELAPNPMQPRKNFDQQELIALSDSIRTYGLIQPIAVKRNDNINETAKYEIIAGERRWRASKMAGLTEIKCTIFEADREDSAMMALVENLQRSDLSYFEEAIAMQTLMNMSGKTQNELARALSITQPTLSNKLRLLKLSERERLMAMENGFSERHCRALVRIESEKDRKNIMLKIIKDKLQANETEKLVEEFLNPTLILIPKQKKKKPFIKGSIKEMKMLYNTVDKAVKLLSNSGYRATWEKEENNGFLEVKIRIKAKK